MTDDSIVSALLAVPLLSLVAGFLLSWLGWEKFFPLNRVTKRTAINLLRSRAFDEWNEFRTLNRDWNPKIVKLVLQNSQALDADFSRVTISQSTFRGTDLSGASFLAALLIDVDFSEAILRGARFKNAVIRGTRWNNALIDDEAAQELESLGIAYREWGMRLVQSIPGIDYSEIRRHILEQERAIYDLTPSQFETLVSKILEQSGCEVMRARDAAEDIGYDIIAKLPPSADGTRQTLVVECANYGTVREIGASRIRKLARHKARLSASGAMLCTNARWTSEAVRAAAATNVRIVDGKTLIEAIKFDRPINFFVEPLSGPPTPPQT